MLSGDSLNINTFLCWWNSTNISNDFWIEGPETLVRVHVTPRRTYFDPSKWRTTYSSQRSLLLESLGDLRETWGIACCTQRESGHHVLWVGRSVFNRAARNSPALPRCHEPSGTMEAQQGRADHRAEQVECHREPALDRARAPSCADTGVGSQKGPENVPKGLASMNLSELRSEDPPGHRLHHEGHQGPAPPPHPRHHVPGRDDHDAGAVQGGHAQGHPKELCGLDGPRDGSQPGQHAPRSPSLCALASGSDQGSESRLSVPRRLHGQVRGGSEDPTAANIGDRVVGELDSDPRRRSTSTEFGPDLRNNQAEDRSTSRCSFEQWAESPRQRLGRRPLAADPSKDVHLGKTPCRPDRPHDDEDGARCPGVSEEGDPRSGDALGASARCLGTLPRIIDDPTSPDDQKNSTTRRKGTTLPGSTGTSGQRSPRHAPRAPRFWKTPDHEYFCGGIVPRQHQYKVSCSYFPLQQRGEVCNPPHARCRGL